MMINHFFRNRFDKWLKRRIPMSKQITLNSGNTFIFPSKAGLHLLLSCFILFLLGTNYQNNLILFLVFFLCSFMVTCLLLSYQNLAGLNLFALKGDAQFAGKDSQFNLRLSHAKVEAKAISFEFQQPSSELKAVVEHNSVSVYACCHQRGYFNPGRVTVRSTFPFGLFNVWTHLDFGFKVLLYPHPVENSLPLERLSGSIDDAGIKQPLIGVDEFSTLKNYQLGESLKSVAWKQVAQGRGWLTKQFEQPAGAEVALDIKLLAHLPVEMRLSFLCYQILELEKKNQRYSLTLGDQQIKVGTGKPHQAVCLQALALHKG